MAGLIAAILLASGCAARSRGAKDVVGPEAWTAAVRARNLDPRAIGYPLATTPEMREAARRFAGEGSARDRLRNLQTSLFDPEDFPFEYSADETFDAIETFRRRRGNCVSFTSLFIALARSLGIRARPAVLALSSHDVEREGDLIVVNNHVIAVYRESGHVTIYDFARSRGGPAVGLRLIDDLWLSGIMANNRGVEALRRGDSDAAIPELERAVTLAPDFAAAYSNLGVAYRRAGRYGAALDAYLLALRLEPHNARILDNIVALKHAEVAESRPAPASESPGQALIRSGDEAMAAGHVDEALRRYRRAAQSGGRTAAEIRVARAEAYLGRWRAAERTLRHMLDRDPHNAEARHLLDLLNLPRLGPRRHDQPLLPFAY